MSLESACAEFPISKKIISNINSTTDITSLITTSRSLYLDLHNVSVKKTFNIPNNVLLIDHEGCAGDFQGEWNNIRVTYEDETTDVNDLYQILFMSSNENLEHINSIRLDLSDNYDNYDLDRMMTFSMSMASFIDELFNLCPNADTLELYSVKCIHFFIIKHLKSPKIKILKDTIFGSFDDYIDENENIFRNVLGDLIGLKEFHIFIRQIEIINEPLVRNILHDILNHLSRQKDNKIVISGNIRQRQLNIFKEFLGLIESYGVNIGLEGNFLCHKEFFKDCIMRINAPIDTPVQNIIELNITLWNGKLFEIFFASLPSFINLKLLKIGIHDQFFNNMLYEETPETLKRCFNEKLLSKIPNVEEFYLKLEDWHSIYDSVDHYLRSYLLKNDATKAILPHLKNKVKVLYLEGIPNMTADMAQIISTNCPEITDLYIEPLQSVDVTFVERMEKLQFINIKGIYRINIPRHVKMVIVTSKYDVDSNMIAGMNTRESCEYFKERLNRNFTVSLRNCNETFLKYNVFFDNFLDWKVYLKKLNYFRCPF